MIERPTYLSQLNLWKDRNLIKVITGVRRCGKSTLLAMFADDLLEQGVPKERIITINMEQLENESLTDYHVLHDTILNLVQPNSMNYVFIDEIQNIPDFQKALDSLYTRPNIDLYVTGSNALLLQGTLTTLLSGRFVEIRMTPLSFAEYCSAFTGKNITINRLYDRYIRDGGFPAGIDFSYDSFALHDYLEGILNTILFKDVAQRLNIANTLALDALVTFMFDNIGNLTSIKRISDVMSTQGVKISPNTIGEYLSGLANSYIFYPVKRYDVRGKRLLKLQEKHYGVDMGLRRILLSNQVRDRGRILENIVYLELTRRFDHVYIGRIGNLEIDFVVEGAEGRTYFQVAESVTEKTTLERELAPFEAIKDNYPKALLTLDDIESTSYEGIAHLNVLDWLLDTNDEINAY